jgi:hypothetical protein
MDKTITETRRHHEGSPVATMSSVLLMGVVRQMLAAVDALRDLTPALALLPGPAGPPRPPVGGTGAVLARRLLQCPGVPDGELVVRALLGLRRELAALTTDVEAVLEAKQGVGV